MASQLNWGKHDSRLVPVLAEHKIELDQRLANAATHNPSSMTAYLQSTGAQWFDRLPPLEIAPSESSILAEEFRGHGTLCGFVDLGVQGVRNSTFGARDYLRGLLLHAKAHPSRGERSPVLDRVAAHFGSAAQDLRSIPEVQAILHAIAACVDGSEDYPYVLFHDGDGIRVRTTSILGDYVQNSDSGLLVPHRAILTHLEEIGFLTAQSIEELEEMINDHRVGERDLQDFFERHPGFLRQWDHRDVFPHVYLTRPEAGPLIPDFLLTNAETQKATLVELKRAITTRPVVRHQTNRVRFANLVMEARSQLLEYKDWFDLPENREIVRRHVGMEIYRPRMMVIVGRRDAFRDGIERAKLSDHHPDLEIVTYDDILTHARRRRVEIERR